MSPHTVMDLPSEVHHWMDHHRDTCITNIPIHLILSYFGLKIVYFGLTRCPIALMPVPLYSLSLHFSSSFALCLNKSIRSVPIRKSSLFLFHLCSHWAGFPSALVPSVFQGLLSLWCAKPVNYSSAAQLQQNCAFVHPLNAPQKIFQYQSCKNWRHVFYSDKLTQKKRQNRKLPEYARVCLI